MTSVQVVQINKMSFLKKCAPKNAPMLVMSRIGPDHTGFLGVDILWNVSLSNFDPVAHHCHILVSMDPFLFQSGNDSFDKCWLIYPLCP